MTPKEKLIQAIQRSPDETVQLLLDLLKTLEQRRSLETGQTAQQEPGFEQMEAGPKRLRRKQGVLVIETGGLSEFDINAFIDAMREERIQNQIGQVNS